jgi:hypothetical protein
MSVSRVGGWGAGGVRLPSCFHPRAKAFVPRDVEAQSPATPPSTPALTSSEGTCSSDPPASPEAVVSLPLPRKLKLPTGLTEGLAPALFDARSKQWQPSRVSLLSGDRNRYLLSSTGSHSGTYGKLRLAIALDSDKPYYVKVVRRQPLAAHTPAHTRSGRAQTQFARENDQNTAREANMMHRFGLLDDAFVDSRRFYLVMPYGKVSLFGAMGQKREAALQQSVGRTVAFQLFSAAHFLHQNGLIHCDIKADNALFDPATGQLQLIDFGMVEPFDLATGRSRPSANYGSYPPPDRFLRPNATGIARPFDDLWATATTVLHLLAATRDYGGDPLSHEVSALTGRAPYDRWQANMRAMMPDGTVGLDLTAANTRIAAESNPVVAKLHRLTARAYAADPALTFFLLANVFDLSVGPLLDGQTLSQVMWTSDFRFGDERSLLDAARFLRGKATLKRELHGEPEGEQTRLLRGLRAVAGDANAQAALAPLLPWMAAAAK